MKILNILNEDFSRSNTIPQVALNTLELRTLKRLADGRVDVETASERELEMILSLVDRGLVDVDGELTDGGREAILPLDNNVDIHDKAPMVDDLSGENDDELGGDGDEINFDLDRELGR